MRQCRKYTSLGKAAQKEKAFEMENYYNGGSKHAQEYVGASAVFIILFKRFVWKRV